MAHDVPFALGLSAITHVDRSAASLHASVSGSDVLAAKGSVSRSSFSRSAARRDSPQLFKGEESP